MHIKKKVLLRPEPDPRSPSRLTTLIQPPHPMPPVAGGLASRPQLPPMVGGSAPRPRNASPHCRFLGTRLHEEKFTARYCQPPFVLAFGFIYAWNVW